jgi:hypothetical protein
VAAALVLATAADVLLPAACQATDGQMVCAWRRTFWAQDALKTPLRGYYTPRQPNCDCWGGSYDLGTNPACGIDSFGPAEFTRLGQIPNDLSLGAIATPAATPGR